MYQLLTWRGKKVGKTAFLGIIAIIAIAVVAFTGFNQTGLFGLGAEEEETVKIGVMLPLTGDAAIYGESVGTAIQLARERINESGGILGKRVEFVVEDSACDAKAGVKAINSLVHLKGMKLVIAAECSGPALSAAPVAEEAKVLYLVAIASNPDIKYAGDYVFRIAPSDNQQGKDIAKTIYKEGFRKAASMFMDNAYGEGIAGVFAKEFEALGGNVVITQRFNQNDNDFRTQLLKVKEVNPDSLFIVGYPQSYQLVIKQMHELGLDVQIFSADTFKDETIIQAVGDKAEGIIFSTYAESGTPEFERFKQAYRERHGKEYGPYGDYAFDSLYVLKAGIEQANSFDPEVLKESLYDLEYQGVTGLTKFDEYGEVYKPYAIMTVRNGSFVQYK